MEPSEKLTLVVAFAGRDTVIKGLWTFTQDADGPQITRMRCSLAELVNALV